MRVGFVVETISSLKVLGPLLFRVRRYAIEPVVFIPEFRKGKSYDTITSSLLKKGFPDLAAIQTYRLATLPHAVEALRVKQLCLLNPYRNFAVSVPLLAEKGIAVFGLDYFVNSLYVAASTDDPSVVQCSLSALKSRVVTSDYWRDLEFTVQPDHKKYAAKFHSLGSTLLDAFEDVNQEQARQALGLPHNKPVVAVFTPNIRDHQAYFFYGLATIYLLRRLARLLRQYCDKRGYHLVVKSRAKQWDARPFLKVADQYIQDLPDQVYPSTSTLLLSSSCLAIHFGSMMVLEAAGASVPSIAFSPETIDKLHHYMRLSARMSIKNSLLNSSPLSLMNFGNVSQSLPVTSRFEVFAAMADNMIRSRSTAQDQYRAFNETFSGWRPRESASERILKHISDAAI